MSKQILDDSIGLIRDPWNWKARLYGTQPRMLQDENSVYQRGGAHKVHQSDAAPPSKSSPAHRSRLSSRIPQPASIPSHESKREKKTVHFLEPEYNKKPTTGTSHRNLPAEPAKLELYEVVSPANDVPRIIDIDYDTKTNRWCIDESATFPDREEPVAMICSKSVLRAMQFADSFPGYSALASPTRMPQFQINRLPDYGVIKNPEGDLATRKASSHDLFHIGNLEEFLLHAYEDPQHVFSVTEGQYMKHWLIDLPQLVTILSNSDTRQKCKSALLDLVHHGIADKVTLQLWGASDPQPELSSDIETLDWATWVRSYRNKISKTLRHDLDRALGFLQTETVPGSSWPTSVHRKLSIMSHTGLTSTIISSMEMCDAIKSTIIEPWSSPANGDSVHNVKRSNTVPSNAARFSERLSNHDEDRPARVQTPYTTNPRVPQSTRPLPLAPGPLSDPYPPRTPIASSGPSCPASESQDLVRLTAIDTPTCENSSRTHAQALAEVDYGTETGGLVDLNRPSDASANEKRATQTLTWPLLEPRESTLAYERCKDHFDGPSLAKFGKRASQLRTLSMNLLKIRTSRNDKTKNNANCYPAFSTQLDEALTAKQRIIGASTAPRQDLEAARQEWLRDQEIIRIADLLKRDLRLALEQERAASRQLEMDTSLAQLHNLCDEVSEKIIQSAEIDNAVKDEMGLKKEQVDVVSLQSTLGTVDHESRKSRGIKQELTLAQASFQPALEQAQCSKIAAFHVDRPHIDSKGAVEWTENSSTPTVTIQDPEGEMLVSLEQPTRMSWTPDDDKTTFRLSSAQPTYDDPNSTRHNASRAADHPSVRSEVRTNVDHSPVLTTPDGSNVSILNSKLLSTDSKEVVESTNGNVATEPGNVFMLSNVFNTVSSQVDHEVNQSIKSADNDNAPSADEDPFNGVTDTGADDAAECSKDLCHDVLVAEPDEPHVDNAAASFQTKDNVFTTPDDTNLDKGIGATSFEDRNNAESSESEEPPAGTNLRGPEELDNQPILASPTNLTNYVLCSPSSSGKKKKGTARKKWTRVEWVE